MAVGADFGIRVEIVQQHELAGEPVQVGRDALREQAQLRIAVALRQVAQDLVVGAVLLDDVEAVFDWAWLAGRARDGVVRRRGSRHAGRGIERACSDRPALV